MNVHYRYVFVYRMRNIYVVVKLSPERNHHDWQLTVGHWICLAVGLAGAMLLSNQAANFLYFLHAADSGQFLWQLYRELSLPSYQSHDVRAAPQLTSGPLDQRTNGPTDHHKLTITLIFISCSGYVRVSAIYCAGLDRLKTGNWELVTGDWGLGTELWTLS